MAIIDAKNHGGSIDENKIFTAFVYEGGIVFNPLTDLKFYAKYSSLFRYPFLDELAEFSGSAYDQFNAYLKPEKGFNAEAGAAWQYRKILDINANFFFMGLEDEIGFGTSFHNENLDQTRRLGTNVGLTFTPLEFFSLNATYSFVNAVFTAGTDKDKRVPMVPSHKIYGSVTLKLPFGLEFGPDFEYTSASYGGGDTANTGDMLESWFLLGARVRYARQKEGRELAFTVSGKNLLNTSYASCSYWGTLYPADGLSVNVSLQYRF